MHDESKKPNLNEICQIEKDLISSLKTVMSHGIFSKEVDSKELGELVDMVKDIAETKRNCWEAHYYETVTKAMEDYDEDESDSMGYNRNRYRSGRYAPTGTGNLSAGYSKNGKMPIFNNMEEPPYVYSTDWNDSMGYTVTDRGHNSYDDQNNKYGTAFREYENARRHYTETKSLEDKNHMDKKAMEHLERSMTTLKEIWKNADPEIRKKVAASVSSLASEFKTV